MTSRPNQPSRTPPVVVDPGAVRYRRAPERIADDIDAGIADITPLARFVPQVARPYYLLVVVLGDHPAQRGQTGMSRYFTLTTTLPFERFFSTYAMASLVDSKGKTRSMTGWIIPESMRDVISRNWSPLARMKRNE
jgi:hypothetical protein